MSVSRKAGAALVARRWWCESDEPVVWAFQAESVGFRVEGCNERGWPLPADERKSFGVSVGRAVGKAGLSAATVLGTMAFGGGDDGRMLHSDPSQRRDLTVLGASPECRSLQLQRSKEPPDAMAVDQVWVLTPRRFAVLIPVGRPDPLLREESSSWQEWGQTLSGMGRVLAGTEPERFGGNSAGERIDPERMVQWFALAPADLVDVQAVTDNAASHCVLTLPDGSGFALDARSAGDARFMAEAVQGYVRGARG